MKNLELTPRVIMQLVECELDDTNFVVYDMTRAVLFENMLKQNGIAYDYSEWTENLEKGLFAYCYTLKDQKLANHLVKLAEHSR